MVGGGLVVGGVLMAVFPSNVDFWVVVVCITILHLMGFENYENIFILQ